MIAKPLRVLRLVRYVPQIAVIADLYAYAFYDYCTTLIGPFAPAPSAYHLHDMHATDRVTRDVPSPRRQIMFMVPLSMSLIYISHSAGIIMLRAAFRR